MHKGFTKKKKTAAFNFTTFLPDCAAKKKKKRYRTTLSASRILSLLSLSLSPLSSNPSFGRRPTQSVLRRRKKKKKKKKAFVVVVLFDSSREEGRAREREFFFVSCVGCGRIQIQTRESKRYPGIRIFRWRLYRSSDSGAWGHVLCAARRLFFLCVRFKTREKKKRWVRRGLVAMVIVGIADDAWHRRR